MQNTQPVSPEEGFSVLIVDDDLDIIRMLDMILRDAGATHIQRARNGRLAITDLVKNLDTYDLIISDWNMPEISGLELLKQIRRRRPKLPFIMLTGRSRQEEIDAAVEAKVTAYISKPFSPHELREKVLEVRKRPEPVEDDIFEIG